MADVPKSSLNPHAPEYIPITTPPPPLPTVHSPTQKNVLRGRLRRSAHPKPVGNETTIMIENIPFQYNRESLMQFLDDYCLLKNQKARDSNEVNNHVFAYDFLHLKMNLKKRRNAGYGFVNFTDHRTLLNFLGDFSERAKAYPNSGRTIEMRIAQIQGKDALVNRYKNTTFVCESEECLPVEFNPPRNGFNESGQVITVGIFQIIPDIPID